MYNVLVVDDEALTLEYLNFNIPKIASDWTVSGTCLDGIEAMKWLHENTVDLIITDIKMPEMSGLDLCEQVRMLYPNQKIIILSGYDDFEYARHALQYGIKEYLLKPISLQGLEESLLRIKAILDSEKAEINAYKSLLELSQTGQNQIIQKFIYAVITDSNVEIRSIYPYLHSMKISLLEGAGLIMLFSLDEDVLLSKCIPSRDISLFKYIVNRVILEFSEKEKNVWVSLDPNGDTVVLISNESVDAAYKAVDNLYNQATEVITEHTGISVSVGISCLFEDVLQMNIAYRQAQTAKNHRLFYGSGRMFYATEGTTPCVKKLDLLYRYISLLRASLIERDILNQQLLFNSIIEIMPQYFLEDVLRFGYYWIDGVTIGQLFWTPEQVETSFGKLLTEKNFQTRESVLVFFTAIGVFLSNRENAEPEQDFTSESIMVTHAKNFIHANYSQPISLALLAEEINVSANYLSTVFHKEVGESYIRYLTRVRMERAIQLMINQPTIKIYEIVDKVGYVSVKHFSYVFKQVYGVSPGEYQQTLNKR